MERKMLGLKPQDKIPCLEIRKRTQIIDIIEYTLSTKTECDYLYGWIRKWSHTQKSHPKW